MNTSKPVGEVVRSTQWIASATVLIGTVAFTYASLFKVSYQNWLHPDYSHGFLVPFFSIFLVYRSWSQAPQKIRWPNPWGLAMLAAGLAIFLIFGTINVGKEWMQGLSLVINLSGIVVLLGGFSALRWLWPAIVFLIFMFPLPNRVENALGTNLQKIAAIASEFMLQTIGYPTYREGVVLHVKDHILEVEKACSGLSMMLTFVALSAGMALIVRRPLLDKALLLASAIPVAILANVIRISLTGVLYNEGGRALGDRIFHDFAGWMMMPIALAILWLGLKLFDWVFVPDLGKASREEVLRSTAKNPAHLFMHAMPGNDVVKTGKSREGAAGQLSQRPKGA